MTKPSEHLRLRAQRRRCAPAFALLALLLALASGLLTASAASAAKPAKSFEIGFADYLYGEPQESQPTLDLTKTVNADIIRVNMYWRLVARGAEPANPRDPADPAYNWTQYDIAIANAIADGFQVDLTVFSAPTWAEGPDRPGDLDKYPTGSWKPDADKFGDFAAAVAQRYSGSYVVDGETLPQVKYFEAWNEPNLSTYITPQWDGKKNTASDIYAKLLDAFYTEVKAVNPTSEVVSGGTAPYGDDAPKGNEVPNRTRPLRFEQELLCLSPSNKRSSCPNGASKSPSFDIYSHHPINRLDPPEAKADTKGDIEIADFGSLTKVMRKAEKLGTTATGGRHELWANEVWWQTDPPDKAEGIPWKKHARWTSQALYMLWDEGVSNVSFLQFRDAKYTPGEFTLASYQTGVYTYGGKRKPTADAVAFPFVTDRQSSKKLLAWGRAPASGKLTIKANTKGKGGYRKVAAFKVDQREIFTKKLKIKGPAKLRATVGGKTSLVWKQKD